MRVRRVLIVCGYGCDLDSPLQPYLDRVAEFCRKHRPNFIILCGGKTQQRTFPGKSEAAVMYRYILDQLCDQTWWHPEWQLEVDSYTTYDNIREAAMLIRFRDHWEPGQDNEVTIFCEATRSLDVAMLARHFLGFPPARGLPPIRIETDSWELMHPTYRLIGAIKVWIAIHFPLLNTLQSRARRKKSLSR